MALRKDIFKTVTIDPTVKRPFLERAFPREACVIHFTPRSGSSWLTDILAATRSLGAANEAFNPNFIPSIAAAVGAQDIDTYVSALLRRFNTYGVFSVEVTAHQIEATFGDFAPFYAYFPQAKHVWLIREDIVMQAVSLAKMVSTQVAHTKGSSAEARASSDARFAYDPTVIRKWLEHIRAAEIASERSFRTHDVTPLRLSYETVIPEGPHAVIDRIAKHIGVRARDLSKIPEGHAKLGTHKNVEFADRFRAEHPEFIAEIDHDRASMIARVDRPATV